MTDHNAVRALDTELLGVLSVLHACDVTEFDRATNCPPWTLKDLVVHLAGTARLPDAWSDGSGTPRRAADYYRRPERATAQYRQHNVDQTRAAASRYPSGPDAVEALQRTRDATVARLRSEDLARVVEVRNVGAMILSDLVATRVVAVAAHALDVAITLGDAPETSESALAVCVPILVDLLGTEPASSLRWSAQDFFERGTGRAPLTEDDSTVLRTYAARFPLIS